MPVHRIKPPQASPTFEKINRDRLKQCAETVESAKRAVEDSKKIAERSRELLETVKKQRRKAS